MMLQQHGDKFAHVNKETAMLKNKRLSCQQHICLIDEIHGVGMGV